MKKRPISVVCLLVAIGLSVHAQQSRPTGSYEELNDTKPHDSEAMWKQQVKEAQLSWATSNMRYAKFVIPQTKKSLVWNTIAWRGERVNGQALLWSSEELRNVTLEASTLKCGSAVIPVEAVKASFVRYVMTDEYSNEAKGSGCGARPDKSVFDSSIVEDVIDPVKALDVQACSTRPIWVNVWVPQSAKAGIYIGVITVKGENLKPMKLQIAVNVKNRVLPLPKDWKFHLDLWQNPYSVARYENVPLWSKEHFDAMRPVMKELADAGQKVITASIIYKPWNGQTEDYFSSMIGHTKHLDGSWTYDYTVFDKWVEFMMSVGIDQQINCYTMIPWALSFDYFDEASNEIKFVNAKPGDPAYEAYWLPFLKDFASHLRTKGWFGKTAIAMDERGLEAMKEAIKVIRKADTDWKIALAGSYHKEIEPELYDLCLGIGGNFPPEVKAAREKRGQVSTYYTCCSTNFPNEFTFSPPAEAVWAMWNAAALNFDGFLRWAYNSWTKDPLLDSRFRSFAAGDCYQVYPGGRSSIRMEKMVEGIQDFEKIRLLRDEFKAKGQVDKLKKLNAVVSLFTLENASKHSAEEAVEMARSVLNTY